MGVYTIFGINGVGKDTVANEIKKNNPDIKVTSMSRILMYILGITETYDTSEKVNEEQYRILESTPQNIMIDIENNQYRQLLEKMAQSEENVIFLTHLVSALRHQGETIYLKDRLTPKWFIELNEQLIQLVAPAELIRERRERDNKRKREIDINEILEQQELCSKEWERISISNILNKDRMHIVNNINLTEATNEINGIICGRNRKKFVESLKYTAVYTKIDNNVEKLELHKALGLNDKNDYIR